MNLIIVGVIATLALYHLIIYMGRKHDYNLLAFSLVCFIISLSTFYEGIIPGLIRTGDDYFIATRVASLILYSISINVFALSVIKPKKIGFHIGLSVICQTILLLVGLAAVLYHAVYHDIKYPLGIARVAFGANAGIFSVVGTVLIVRQKTYKEKRLLFSAISLLILMLGAFLVQAIKVLNIIEASDLMKFFVMLSVFFYSFALAGTFNKEHHDLIDFKQNLESRVEERTRELSLATQNLETLTKEKTDLFVNIAHETKTPLTLISHFLDRYMDGVKLSDDLIIIKQNIDKMLRDIVNFLDYEKLSKNSIDYDNDQVVNLSQLLAIRHRLFSVLAQKKEITMSAEIEDEIYVKADPIALERIFNNLIDNAIKFTARGGAVTVTLLSEKENCIASICDTGCGISEDHLENIFVPYYQVSHKKQNFQGIGMGLATVKKITDMLCGTITISSKENQGTTFAITLKRHALKDTETASPLDEASEPYDTVPPFDSVPDTGFVPGRDTLLVVDDNISLLYDIKLILGNRYNLFFARDGIEAIESLDRIPRPDCILSDVMMDHMDGHALFEKIRALPGYLDVPFIFLSAKTSPASRLEAISKGAIDYIYKPFTEKELSIKIDSFLQNQKLYKLLHEKDKFMSLGVMFTGITHEIYNPLSGISGPLDVIEQLLNKKEIDRDKIERHLLKIRSNAFRIEEIIKSFKEIYYQGNMDRERIDIHKLLHSIFLVFQSRCEDRIRIDCSIGDKVNLVTNKSALTHVLVNLFSNAVDSITDKGTISVEIIDKNGNVTVSIKDTGKGIGSEYLGKIFNPFYSQKETGDGFGLGLFIVKDLVLRMNWRIDVHSVPGEGSEFVVTI